MKRLEEAKNDNLLYHMTTINNLEGIICNGLMSRAELEKHRYNFIDVANQEIIAKRMMSNMIPFHFTCHSAFDYKVQGDHPDLSFVYLTITREYARAHNFFISPKHPLSAVEEYDKFPYDEGFKLIDWEAMKKRGNDDRHVHSTKMAECLCSVIIPISDFDTIFVEDNNISDKVKGMFDSFDIRKRPRISVDRYMCRKGAS